MRTAVEILSDFDAPSSSGHVANGIASPINSVRERVALEVLLDVRDELAELVTKVSECKDELVEIKENTAGA